MKRNYWVRATVELVRGYHGVLTSELVSGCEGVVLRLREEEATVDVAWIGTKSGKGDEIEHRVPLDTLVFDTQLSAVADHLARKVASRELGRHGRVSGGMHEMCSTDSARVVCLPHRHGGAAVRLDFWCKGCGDESYDAVAFQHQEHLLDYVDGQYVGSDPISKLDHRSTSRLPDGARRVDRRGLTLLVRAMFDAQILEPT